MHVINPATGMQWDATCPFDLMEEDTQHFLAKTLSLKVGAPFFGAERHMQPNSR
jgi:hypothetical protein